MWLLSCPGNVFRGKSRWLRPGHSYIVGRTKSGSYYATINLDATSNQPTFKLKANPFLVSIAQLTLDLLVLVRSFILQLGAKLK
jgi:hypothetical protein